MRRSTHLAICAILVAVCGFASAQTGSTLPFVDAQLAAHAGQSGAYVLDSAEEALLARAWLADHAEHTIEVQYFIWSKDNIGILAAESLLRAADRGVKIRVIVDDLLMDAPDETLLALSQHPNFDIRIYNPKVSVGVPLHKRIWNALTDLRSVNQRMHDKTFVVDGKVAITGGRNMAAEYYDYHSEYNFRDRDVLLAGEVVKSMRQSFERFWASELAVAVENIFADKKLGPSVIRATYESLHTYAKQPANFAPSVHHAIEGSESAFARISAATAWGRVDFVCDTPGKNQQTNGLNGGGQSGRLLRELVKEAKSHLFIQSPYLIPSEQVFELFSASRNRGIDIRISTNSLASTDNLQAFAGYRNSRDNLLAMGVKVFEYRPDAATQTLARKSEIIGGLSAASEHPPTFGLHAKTLVIDSKIVFIGTYNLDPRSENLNTEVGAVIYNEEIARRVADAIRVDMQPENSWSASSDDPDQHTSFAKRSKVRFWQMMPVKPLL